MKIIPDEFGTLAITAYGAGWIEINGIRHQNSVLICSTGHQESIAISHITELSIENFQHLSDLSIDIVLLGTGRQQLFVTPDMLTPLMAKGIGFESMNTSAACRTFNVLSSEGRKVGALLCLSPEN